MGLIRPLIGQIVQFDKLERHPFYFYSPGKQETGQFLIFQNLFGSFLSFIKQFWVISENYFAIRGQFWSFTPAFNCKNAQWVGKAKLGTNQMKGVIPLK